MGEWTYIGEWLWTIIVLFIGWEIGKNYFWDKKKVKKKAVS